jgi:tetratricopeptide (TPR) repeat protein
VKPFEAQANDNPTLLLEKERELLSLIYANRAASLLMVGAYEAATNDCQKAINFSDKRNTITECGVAFVAKVYCRMARSFFRLGNIKEAEANFNLAVLISENVIKPLDTEKCSTSELSVVQQLNRIMADATIGLGEAHRCQEAMNIARTFRSIDDVLEICPGLESFHEQKINLLIKKRRWSDVSLHCEKLACDVAKLDGVFTEDLHPFNPFPGVEEAKYLKTDYFTNGNRCERKLSSKAVAEAVLRLPNSILPSYLRALRLEERYTEAARACTALEDLSNSSSPRFRLKQSGRTVFSWLLAERGKLRRTVAIKDRGDANFKNGDYRLAAINYSHCLGIDSDIGSTPNSTAGGRLHAVLFCNRAACYMALRKYRDASNDCNSALAIQVRNFLC